MVYEKKKYFVLFMYVYVYIRIHVRVCICIHASGIRVQNLWLGPLPLVRVHVSMSIRPTTLSNSYGNTDCDLSPTLGIPVMEQTKTMLYDHSVSLRILCVPNPERYAKQSWFSVDSLFI